MRLTIFFALLLAATSASAQTVSDDFNRPNSTNLGPDWSEQNGDLEIKANHGQGAQSFQTHNWMYHTGFSATYTNAVAGLSFFNNNLTGTSVGLVLGLDPSAWSGVSVRLADNDGDMLFDRLFFEAAIGAGAWFNQPTPVKYDLPTPLANGRMTVRTISADTVRCTIEDGTGTVVGTYDASGISGSAFPPTGDRVGVLAFDKPAFDDFTAGPNASLIGSPSSLSVATGGVQTLDINLGAAHALELFLLLGSSSGTTPGTLAGPGVLLPLNVDNYLLHTLVNPNTSPLTGSLGSLDLQGQAQVLFTLPPAFDPSLVGMTLHHAAVAFTVTGPGVVTPTAATDAASVMLL